MKIKEFKNGKFQVWDTDSLVLRPETLEWEGEHQRCHDFMYFDTKASAIIAAEKVKEKTIGEELLHEYDI